MAFWRESQLSGGPLTGPLHPSLPPSWVPTLRWAEDLSSSSGQGGDGGQSQGGHGWVGGHVCLSIWVAILVHTLSTPKHIHTYTYHHSCDPLFTLLYPMAHLTPSQMRPKPGSLPPRPPSAIRWLQGQPYPPKYLPLDHASPLSPDCNASTH